MLVEDSRHKSFVKNMLPRQPMLLTLVCSDSAESLQKQVDYLYLLQAAMQILEDSYANLSLNK